MTRTLIRRAAAPPSTQALRVPALHKLRAIKMARSAHAYVRGSTEAFYAWLDSAEGTRLPVGPPVWICGDCHVGNLGPVGQSVGSAKIEIRDLDQSVIGNPAYDLVRIGLSLAMAARSSDLPGVTTARMTEFLVEGYENAFAGEIPPEDIGALPNPIRFVMKRAVARTQRELFSDRLGAADRRFSIGRRFWPLDGDERAAVATLISEEPIRQLVARMENRDNSSTVSFVDAAFWVKGCSSLGNWRCAALVEVRDPTRKKGKRRSLSLLDLKQAIDPIAPAMRAVGLADHPALRVLMGARKIAPALGDRMEAAKLLDHSVFIRELLPQDLKVELDQLTVEDGRDVARYLGMVVGRAHARQLSMSERQKWLTEIQGRRTKNIDVPGWLWEAVVDLVAVHERAYLEHCRRYALTEDTPLG